MKKYLVKPNTRIDLKDYDADDTGEFGKDKRAAKDELDEIEDALDELQERLYAESSRAILFVLQAMDTGGKDGTIRKVFGRLNPAGCRVASFKAPSSLELSHDFLWRVHEQMPRRGEITIFNRSQYEDVLVVRVHNLVPQEVWERRYDQINAFEKILTDEGTTIVKFFLHISKDEQKKRLEARAADPTKQWKFNPNDLKERLLWDDYQRAYEDALSKTSTEDAPWYVIPANRKWYRDIVVARVVLDTMKRLAPQYPRADLDFSKLVIE